MLDHIDSYEISEWMAFEHAFGPIGPEYRDEALALIHDQLQLLCSMYGAVNWQDKNPVGEPKPIPRPSQVFLKEPEKDKDEYDEKALKEKAAAARALSMAFDHH